MLDDHVYQSESYSQKHLLPSHGNNFGSSQPLLPSPPWVLSPSCGDWDECHNGGWDASSWYLQPCWIGCRKRPDKELPLAPSRLGFGGGANHPTLSKKRVIATPGPCGIYQTYLLHPILVNIISLVSWKTNWQISKLPEWRFRYLLKEPHSWPSKQAPMHVHTLAWKMSRKVIYSTMNQCQQWIKSVTCQPINKLTVRCDRMSFFTDTTRQQHGILSSNKRN